MTSTAPARRAEEARLPWWTTGDWNGLFGLGTNVLLNVIVIAGLCLGVVGLSGDTVYGRILPALAIALPLGNIWYAVLARRMGFFGRYTFGLRRRRLQMPARPVATKRAAA